MAKQNMKRFGPPLKTVGENSNFVPVLAIDRNRQIGKSLWEQAKKSKPIRLQLAETLLRREPFFPCTPHLSQGEVVTTIRVARSASSDLGLDSRSRERWQMIENLVLCSLVQNSWPLLSADITKEKGVIRKIKSLLPPKVFQKALADLDELEKEYEARIAGLKFAQREDSSEVREGAQKVLESIGVYRSPRPGQRRSPRPDRGGRGATPAGGRPISEWKQRWVATFYMFKDCGDSDSAAAETIVALLKKQNIRRSASKIMEAVKIYEHAAASHDGRDPEDFLELELYDSRMLTPAPAGDEHCLFLNIASPLLARLFPRPVKGSGTVPSRADALVNPSELPEFWLQKLGEFGFLQNKGLAPGRMRQRSQITFRSQVTI